MAEIGSILRETRMRARIDLGQVEEDTKIRAKYLRAMENEEWTLLPGNVFARSFLRTYAEYLHVDPRPLLDEFQLRTDSRAEAQRVHSRRGSKPARRGARRSPTRHTQRQRAQASRFLSPPVVIVAALVLIVAALAAIGLAFDGKSTSGTHTPTNQTVSTPTTPHHSTGTTGQHRSGTTAASAVSSLKLVATGAVYVCVKSGAGKQLIANTFSAGQATSTVHAEKLLVTLGNANAKLYVDGKAQTLETTSTPIKLTVEHGKVSAATTGPTCA